MRRKTDKRGLREEEVEARAAGATLLVSQETIRLRGRPLVEEIAMEVNGWIDFV